jgi:hypothetical protein
MNLASATPIRIGTLMGSPATSALAPTAMTDFAEGDDHDEPVALGEVRGRTEAPVHATARQGR